MTMEKSDNPFSLSARLKSFSYAARGFMYILKYEHNARIHLFISGIVLIMGFLLHIKRAEWVLVLLCMGFVLTAEMINTAIEKLADVVSPQKNETIRVIKDISAAVVLLSSFIAMISGLIIFVPCLWEVCCQVFY
jgi:diacylglycerol kinase